jgi:hypothetical protein
LIETTERFLKEIAERIGLHSVDEVRLFPPMRQGGVETCVAVVAATPLGPELLEHTDPNEPPEALVESTGEEYLPIEEENREIVVHRHTVFTARYRHTIKGIDRGKWEVDVQAEAVAPLVTIDAVVKGVIKRSGEPFEPERISAAAFRAIVGEPVAGA